METPHSGIAPTEAVHDFLLLQRITQRINSIHELDVLLEQIVDDVKETFGYNRSGILFLDEEANELEIVAVRGWTINYHVKGDRFKVGWGMIGHVAETGRTYYVPDVTRDPHYMVSERTTRSEIDIPIRARGKLIGVFNAQHPHVDAFPPHRIQLLEALAGHIGVAIENARLFERERVERRRMQSELGEARALQARMFPAESPVMEGFRITGFSRPCYEVGGDWYDYIPLPDGQLGIVVGDVSGKGLAAALVMATARSILRMHSLRSTSPARVLDAANQLLRPDLPSSRFVTMIYAVLDPRTRRMTFANAGHHPPILVERQSPTVLRTQPELPVGIGRAPYSDHVIELTRGSAIYLYTDGLVEARAPEGEEFGEERLLNLLASDRSGLHSVASVLDAHMNGREPIDDVTVVAIESE